MKIFITGASGFLGKNLIKKLSKTNHKITALVHSKYSAKTLRKIAVDKIIIGDITKPLTFQKIISKNDLIIHLAAIKKDWPPDKIITDVNSNSVKNLFVTGGNIKHIIVISSVYVYGKQDNLPIKEGVVLKANDVYGLSKVKLEEVTKKYSKKTNIPYTILRPSIIYGPGDKDGMVAKMIELIKLKKFPLIGNGENLLDLIYIDDMVQAIIVSMKRSYKNKILNIAFGKPITLNKFINLVMDYTNSHYSSKHLPKKLILFSANMVQLLFRIGYNLKISFFAKEPKILPVKLNYLFNDNYYDITNARKLLNFKPRIDYPKGLEKTIAWMINK